MKAKISDLERRWREFRAGLAGELPAEIEFSGQRTRSLATTRRRRPYPELAGLKGRNYYRAYSRLKRAQERQALQA